jgi:hypothetical protein
VNDPGLTDSETDETVAYAASVWTNEKAVKKPNTNIKEETADTSFLNGFGTSVSLQSSDSGSIWVNDTRG